jgi:hypothetical protein
MRFSNNRSKIMKRHLACSLLAACLTLLPVGSYGQAIPITSIPFNISQPGKYVIQNDLTTAGGDGITVKSSSVTIDLNGFTISTTARPNSNAGIRASGFSGIAIRNGAIDGFSTGIATGDFPDVSSNITIENVRLDVLDFGIILKRCQNSVIRNCEISKGNLSRFGFAAGITINLAGGNLITGTTVSGTAGVRYPNGVLSEDSYGNSFENDYFVSCNTGMKLSPPDKYRSITTTDCPTAISGGIDVDGVSN